MPSVSFARTLSNTIPDAEPSASPEEAAASLLRQPLRPSHLHVKNTFLNYKERSDSLDDFYEERQTQSCPSSPVGRGGYDRKPRSRFPGLTELDTGSSARSSCSTIDTAATPGSPAEDDDDRPSPGRDVRRTKTWAVSTESSRRLAARAQASHGEAEVSRATVLRLEQALPQGPRAAVRQNAAALVSAGEIPSLGSVGHHARQCKPCAFVATSGCSNGGTCEFCHLCEPGEKKRRQKEKRTMRSAMRDLRNMRRQAAATSQGVGLVMSSSGQAPVRAGARAAEPLRALASLA